MAEGVEKICSDALQILILFASLSQESLCRYCLQKLLDSEEQIKGYGKERELLFAGSCNSLGSHISGVYPEGKIAAAYFHEIMQ